MGAGKKVWGYYPAGDVWLPLRCNALGQLEIDLSLVALGDLGDVNFGALADWDIIRWNAAAGEWQDATVPQLLAQGDLDDLSDVNVVGVANLDLLQWNAAAGEWQVNTPGAMAGSINFDDLADVNVAGPVGWDAIYWNAGLGEWRAVSLDQYLATILTVRGDILRRGAAVPERYALGAAGTYLRAGALDPAWAVPTFLELSDTPAAYAGMAGRSPVVNGAANALEFDCRASSTCAIMTVYVDSAAVGTGDGTSWANAFTTIQAAWDSLPTVIAHDVTIKVAEGATPYREEIAVAAKYVVASVTIEGEYYWQGNCAANVGGAGEITNPGAFGLVNVGDKVFILDLNGANGRAQDYEVGLVDSIANAPNRIGTNLAKTPTTNWLYVIVRTEISGSDDGTDPGTARDHCFKLTSVDNIYIYGFYFTFSDLAGIHLVNSRNIYSYYNIFANCDLGVKAVFLSGVYMRYCYVHQRYLLYCESSSVGSVYYSACNTDFGLRPVHMSNIIGYYLCIDASTYGVYQQYLANVFIGYSMILRNGANIGVLVAQNSTCRLYFTTNAAATPESPAGTVDNPYIG